MLRKSARAVALVVALAPWLGGAAYGTVTYIGQFGSAGTGNGQFSQAYGIAVAPTGDVYVTDNTGANRIEEFSATGVFENAFGGTGSGNGQFNRPTAVGVAPNGNVYVMDAGNSRVEYFTASGSYLGAFSVGSNTPSMTVGSDGLYTLSYNTSAWNTLTKWSFTGTSLFSTSTTYSASTASGLAVAGNYAWSLAGNGAPSIIRSAIGPTYFTNLNLGTLGSTQLQAIAASSVGVEYVTRTGPNYVEVVGSDGTALSNFGAAGTGPGQFSGSYGIAVGNNGLLYATNTNGSTVNNVQCFFDSTAFVSGTASFTNPANGPINAMVSTVVPASVFSPQVQLGAQENIAAGMTLLVGGRTTIQNQGLLQLTGGTFSSPSIVIQTGGTLQSSGGYTVASGNTIQLNSGTLDALVTNSGLIYGGGTITGNVSNTSTGQVQATSGSVLTVNGSSNTNQGKIRLMGGTLSFGFGGLTNQQGGLIQGGGTLTTVSGLINQGTMQFTSDSFISGSVDNAANLGQITITDGARVTFFDTFENDAGGVVVAKDASRVSYLSTVYARTGSTFSTLGSGEQYFEGTLQIGNSPGLMQAGNVDMADTSELSLVLGGTVPGTGYGQMASTGEIVLEGGALNVGLYGGFVPAAGDTFDIMVSRGIRGDFGQISLPALPEGLSWDTSNLYTNGSLVVQGVPEPASALLLCGGLGIAGAWRRRRG